MHSDATTAALSLLSAEAVRSRAHRLLELGLEDRLGHFRIKDDRLDAATDLVIETARATYPRLDVPLHSRWRHFVLDGKDRWAALDTATVWKNRESRARAAFDLAITSVLLDAGAGSKWHYRDPSSGNRIGRSEGLALASFAMFAEGTFSSDASDPLRTDADTLANLSEDALAHGFQVTAQNPLPDLTGRAELLRRLGRAVSAAPHVFGRYDRPRPGGLFDILVEAVQSAELPAPVILSNLLRHLVSIWPSRLILTGIPLGDCWRHPALKMADMTDGFVPLHKLSQWMAYSLIEPIEAAGIRVTDINGLTGLAEYRNGGLFVDTGVLALRNPEDADLAHDVSASIVVEWRALTVALLDRLADRMREKLRLDRMSLPLARVLEGGTWAAGRKIARDRRPDGSPPIRIVSDGTVL